MSGPDQNRRLPRTVPPDCPPSAPLRTLALSHQAPAFSCLLHFCSTSEAQSQDTRASPHSGEGQRDFPKLFFHFQLKWDSLRLRHQRTCAAPCYNWIHCEFKLWECPLFACMYLHAPQCTYVHAYAIRHEEVGDGFSLRAVPCLEQSFCFAKIPHYSVCKGDQCGHALNDENVPFDPAAVNLSHKQMQS